MEQKPETPAPQPEPVAVTEEPKAEPAPPQIVPAQVNSHEQLMQDAGIAPEDWKATDYIVAKESTWCPYRWNGDHRDCDTIAENPGNAFMGSGAYGLCQAMPASKMATEGEDYLTNPVTQLRWCHKYAHSRYGSWWSSFAFWQANKWW